MKKNLFFLLYLWAVGIVSADYAGPLNGNGNAYGVPSDSFKPPPSGPYPPSGWKPAGRRLVLPGETRLGYQPLDTGYGQPPPSQYGPSVDNSFPPNNQYIPGSSVTGPSGNGNGHVNGNGNGNGHKGNGFSNGNGRNGNGYKGNGFSNGNGHNGNGHNGNGHNGNGLNGNGHNGNGHNGNGFNGNGHNGNGFPTGNGHNGNGFPTGNGHNGNGFPTGNGHNGNGFPTGNGHNGNGFPTGNGHNGNGFPTGNGHNGNGLNGNGHNGNGHNGNGHNGNGHNGNGHNGNGLNGNGHNGNGLNGNGHNGNGLNGNGHNGNGLNGNGHNGNGLNGNGHNGNGFPTGNGQNGNGVSNGGNGHNGNGINGSNGKIPTFLTSGPGLVYPFVQVSVPGTVTAVRPGNGIGAGDIYPVFHVPSTHQHHSGTGIFTSLDSGTALTYGSTFPTFATASAIPNPSNLLHVSHGNSHALGTAQPTFLGHSGGGLISNGIGQHYTILTNGLFQKSNLLGAKNGLNNLHLQYTIGHSSLGNSGVPVL